MRIFLFIFFLLCSSVQAGIVFDGDADVVTGTNLSDSVAFASGQEATVMAWVNLTSEGEGTGGYIFVKGLVSPDLLVFRVVPTMAMQTIWLGTSNMVSQSGNSAVPAGEDVCLAWTSDGGVGAADYDLFVNGSEVSSYATQTSGTSLNDITGYTYSIGDIRDGTRTVDGTIYEVAVWNKILTEAEINRVCSSRGRGEPLKVQGEYLKLYLPMNNGEAGTSADGDAVYDRSGYQNDGLGDDEDGSGLMWVADPDKDVIGDGVMQ